jgi:hypothetical protein
MFSLAARTKPSPVRAEVDILIPKVLIFKGNLPKLKKEDYFFREKWLYLR